MSSTLSEGVRVPDIGSTSWGADVNFNWGLLNTALANISGNVKVDVANTWTAPQTFTETISGSIDGVAARAVGDEDGNNIKTALASKAADADVVHKAGAETITGNKTFTGATATHNITPETNGTYSLGSSSYQWASVYAQSYYYNGTAWGLDKSNTWTGTNSYTGVVLLNSSSDVVEQFKQKLPKDVSASNDAMARVNTVIDSANHYVVVETLGHWASYVAKNITLKYKNDSAKQGAIEFRLYSDGTGIFYPQSPFGCDLGNSYNKWKTLNGVNPGALSLPNADNAISLDTTNVSMDGTYTYLSVSVNGWLYIALKDTTIKTDGELTFYIGDSGTSSAYAKWAVNFVCSTDGYVRCFIPVLANSRIRIRVNPNGGSPTNLSMTIYPCLGNV